MTDQLLFGYDLGHLSLIPVIQPLGQNKADGPLVWMLRFPQPRSWASYGWGTFPLSRLELIMFMLQLNRKLITCQAFISGWRWMNEQRRVLAGQLLCNCTVFDL